MGRSRAMQYRGGFIGKAVLPSILTNLCISIFALTTVCADTQEASALVRSGCEVDYPPFCIVHEDDRADGFSVELMRAALAKMGREVTFRTGPWSEVRSLLERGEIDCLPLVGRTPEREELFDFTVPYLTMHGAIVVRKDTDAINTLADLRGRRVGVMQGDNAEEFLRRKERDFEIVTAPTYADAFNALAEGLCDAVVVQRLVALRLLEQTGLNNLKIVDNPIPDFAQAFCFAVKDGDSEILALLNEGLALCMTDGTHRRLHVKWFAAMELPTNRPIVIGGDHNYPPFEFLDKQGRPAGYNVDLIRAVAAAAGIDISIRLGPWPEMMRALERGEIDAMQGMFYSPERDATLDFSQAHIVNHCVAVVREADGPPPAAVDELAGKSIVVQEGDIMHEFCRKHGLTDQLMLADSQEEALKAVAEGKRDCALVARMSAFYWIGREGWDNLVVGRTPLASPEYCFAVPSENKSLLAQLSEGLTAIANSGEYRSIHEKWLGVYSGYYILLDVLKYIAMVAGPLVLIALFASFWSWVLRKQVASRTLELCDTLVRLQRSDSLLKASQKISKIGGWEYDVDCRKVFWTDQTYRIHGMEPAQHAIGSEELVGLSASCYAEEDSARVMAAFKACEEKGTPYELECRFTDAKGRKLWIRTSGHPIFEDGRVVRIAGDIQDITERKWEEAKFRSYVENAPYGILIADRSGRYIDVNSTASEISGYSRDELLEMSILDLSPSDGKGEAQRHFEAVIENGRSDGDIGFVRKDGEIRRWHVLAVKLEEDRFLGFAEDITERECARQEHQNLQYQFLHAQKMESVGRLAGGVAHDFNNLIMGIMGYTDLCRDGIDSNHPIREYLDEITNAAERSANLTRQLLAFARKQTISPQVVNINDAVGSMLKMLMMLIGEDINLVWEPCADVWLVKADTGQIDQILANLCVNARDAIRDVGKVTIETGNATFDDNYCIAHAGFKPGEFVLLAVSDDGCGMDRETLANVFEPFFTTKGLGAGTGLGLATVYGIVKQNEGFINAYSEPGEGTTFKIYLPRFVGEDDQRDQVEKTPKGIGGSETILLVEDETSILETMLMYLEDLGYTVLTADAPKAALAIADEYSEGIDMLITDVVMPGMNGRELAEKLTQDYPAMKVLYMSGYTANVIAHRGVLDEGTQFINKPIGRDTLARKVREILG